jgi:cardiolipin synthase (CMP-forming)
MKWNYLPNAITIIRIVMAFPLLYLLMTQQALAAFWLALIAGGTDFVDGYLAKKYHWQTTLGGLLDPIADKCLLTVCFIGLAWQGAIAWWLFAAVILRDVVILTGALIWWKTIGPFKASPSMLGKLTTFMQIVFVAIILAERAFVSAFGMITVSMLWLMLLMTVASGLDYFFRYGALALKAWSKKT